MSARHGFGDGGHDEWEALAVGWALTALEPDDEARFVVHLADCALCAATIRETTRTLGDLAYAVPDVEPPPQLGEKIMAAVAREPRSAGPASSGGPTPPAGSGPAAGSAAAAGPAWSDGTASSAGLSSPAGPAPGGAALSGGAAPVGGRPPAGGGAPSGPAPSAGPTPSAPAPRAADPIVRAVEVPNGTASRTAWAPGTRPEFASRLAGPGGATGRHAAAGPSEPEPETLGRAAAAGWRRRLRTIAAVAAGVALIAGLTIWNVVLRRDQDRLQAAVARREALIEQLTRPGPARVAALDNTGNGRRLATIVVRTGGVDVVTESLAPNDVATTRYWLWALAGPTDTHPVPLGGFDVAGRSPSVRTVVSTVAGLFRVPIFAVSREPGRSIPAGPTDVVAVGQVGH